MKVGVKTFLLVTMMSILGTVLFKVVFNKYHVAGVTDLVNAA